MTTKQTPTSQKLASSSSSRTYVMESSSTITPLLASDSAIQEITTGEVISDDCKVASINSSEENLHRALEGGSHEAPKNEIPMHSPIVMCILCQQTRVQVVFLPCSHCVLCTKCFEIVPASRRSSSSGSRQQVCLVCRTPIQSISQATPARYIQPRVYAASLFL